MTYLFTDNYYMYIKSIFLLCGFSRLSYGMIFSHFSLNDLNISRNAFSSTII